LTSELAIASILTAFNGLDAKDVIIVPVSISYERLFEMNLLSSDKMFNQKANPFTGMDVLKTLRNMKGEQLGKVMVKFSQPISLNNFQAHGNFNIEQGSLMLSTQLYSQQLADAPVTLTTVVAALLLHEKAD